MAIQFFHVQDAFNDHKNKARHKFHDPGILFSKGFPDVQLNGFIIVVLHKQWFKAQKYQTNYKWKRKKEKVRFSLKNMVSKDILRLPK